MCKGMFDELIFEIFDFEVLTFEVFRFEKSTFIHYKVVSHTFSVIEITIKFSLHYIDLAESFPQQHVYNQSNEYFHLSYY